MKNAEMLYYCIININPQSILFRFYHEIIFFVDKMLFVTNTLRVSSILFVDNILELPESTARFCEDAEKSAKLGAARIEI